MNHFVGALWFHRWTPTLGVLSWTGTAPLNLWPRISGEAEWA